MLILQAEGPREGRDNNTNTNTNSNTNRRKDLEFTNVGVVPVAWSVVLRAADVEITKENTSSAQTAAGGGAATGDTASKRGSAGLVGMLRTSSESRNVAASGALEARFFETSPASGTLQPGSTQTVNPSPRKVSRSDNLICLNFTSKRCAKHKSCKTVSPKIEILPQHVNCRSPTRFIHTGQGKQL